MQTSHVRSLLFVALVGCAGSGQLTYTDEAAAPDEVVAPDLVMISPGVQVIANIDQPIFYDGYYYWRYDRGSWFRSPSHTHGWIRVQVAPARIRAIARPASYAHYRGEAHASVGPGSRSD